MSDSNRLASPPVMNRLGHKMNLATVRAVLSAIADAADMGRLKYDAESYTYIEGNCDQHRETITIVWNYKQD